MDARTDDAKYGFGCRILENFLPKIYGGAFRRPGTMFLDKQDDLAHWELNTKSNRILHAEGTAPTATESQPYYSVGSLWLRNVQTIYSPSDVSSGAAVWAEVAGTHHLSAWSQPTRFDGSNFGYAIGSMWFDQSTGAIFRATDVTPSASVWVVVTAKTNVTATTAPGTGDDTDDGYTMGSYWIRNVRSLYECSDDTSSAAVWDLLSDGSNLTGDRAPSSADTDYQIGETWINQRYDSAWKLTALDHQEPIRLIDFNVSADTRYQLAFGDGYMRIYNSDGTPFIDKVNSPYNLPFETLTPYRSEDLYEVQFARLGNVAYFCHPKYPPQRLARSFVANFFSDTFAWSEVEWKFPAFRDINTSDVTATPSASSGDYSVISFSANPFTETTDYREYEGARILLSHRRDAARVKIDLTATASSSGVSVLGGYQVFTYGTFTGSLRIQSQDAAGNWNTIKSFEFSNENGGRQIVYNATAESELTLRLDVTYGSGSGAVAYLEAGDSSRVGYARIWMGVPFDNSLPVVPCAVEKDFDSTEATTEWAIEAWAKYSGYPRSVCFHEQRLWFGGTELQPNTFWGSAVNDFENFRRGAYDSDSVVFTLSAQEGSSIQSMVSHDALLIFTQSEEWTASTSEQTAITPSNIFVRRQSRFGSAHKQAFVAANNLLFLQRGERKLRQFVYGRSGGEGQASDLTVLAEHVTRSGIRQMAYQQQPDPIIWCVLNNGALISLTYEVDQGVIAWARHSSGSGKFESVAVIYGGGSDADQVWFVVNRGGARIIERFDPAHFNLLDENDAGQLVYVDSAVRAEAETPFSTLSGLGHIEGETVAILADGGVEASQAVASGEVTIEDAAQVMIAGIPYASIMQPSKIELEMEDGSAQGRKFVCKRVTLNLWKTFGAQYADSPAAPAAEWFEALGRSSETMSGEPEELFTGMVDIVNLGAHRESIDFTIRQTLPLPCNILAIVPKIDIHGN